MSYTDRELLELAWLATQTRIGVHKLRWDKAHKCYWRDEPDGDGISGPWRPLDDDGDALRLAVRLNLCVRIRFEDFMHDSEFVEVRWDTADGREFCLRQDESEPFSTTRLAIVRAAAEIGKAMQDGATARKQEEE